MKRLAILLASLALLSACDKRPESSTAAGVEFVVDRLFVHDGCTVYRFRDGSGPRYFTRCDGAVSSDASWTETCGKGCSRQMSLPTGKGG